MKARHEKNGDVIIEFNSQGEQLLSPDGTQQLLPCDECGKLKWVNKNVVSTVCYTNKNCRPDDLQD